MAGSKAEVVKSLVANSLIAAGKGVVASITGSGAMLAETLHTVADCGNQLLLLLGIKEASRQPDSAHPLGYGRTLYFWSFIVALLLFTGGGMFSIYEGIHKIRHPEEVQGIALGLGVLAFALVVEGWATLGNLKEMKRRRGQTPLFRYLRDTKDSDLVVIFGENSAAVLGLVLAMLALMLAGLTGDGRWDGAGSLSIGVVLVGVAVFLAIEVKSLLIGESASPSIDRDARALAATDPRIVSVLRLLTVQQGPGEVMVALKISLRPELSVAEVCGVINDFEAKLHAQHAEVRWIFVEPDLPKQDDSPVAP